MGNRSGKNEEPKQHKKKNRITKILKRFEVCPAGHRPENNFNNNTVDNSQTPDKKVYQVKSDHPIVTSGSRDSEWVDVPLSAPESPPRYVQHSMTASNKNDTPKVPPRKYLRKKKLLLDESPVSVNDYQNRKPVEEPAIIPKKEAVHICDGTHHHTTNYPPTKLGNAHKEVKQEIGLMESIPISVKHKNVSVISLPDYIQLGSQIKENEEDNISNKLKPEKTRNISVASLPNENKVSFSAATAERLESYMTKCKSFGSLQPKQFIDKMCDQAVDHESDSDDSWDGLDDWDIPVIENESERISAIPPYTPKSTVKYKYKEELPVQSKNPPLSIRMPHCIEEGDESHSSLEKKQQLSFVKKQGKRRESIDDFFTSTCEPSALNREEIDEIIKNTRIGRRGSEVIHGYDNKCYPFKMHETDPSFKSDSFFSTALIENESHLSNPHFPFQNKIKLENKNQELDNKEQNSQDILPLKAARRRSGSVNTDEIISHLQCINYNHKNQPTKLDSPNDSGIHEEISSPSQVTDKMPTFEVNEHSNLLKIISENPIQEIHSQSKHTIEDSGKLI